MPETKQYHELQTHPDVVLKIYPVPWWRHAARDEKRKPPNFHPFETIASYIEGALPLSQTVQDLTHPIEQTYDQNKAGPSLACGPCLETWQTLNNIIEQTPHTDQTTHSKLAGLLAAIRSRESDVRLIDMSELHEGFLFQDLPGYEPSSFGDFRTPTSSIESYGTDYLNIDETGVPEDYDGASDISTRYTNMNAFLAHLIQLPNAPLTCEAHAIIALSGALEDDLSPRGLDLNVPGAAVWITYAGKYILYGCSGRAWPAPLSGTRIESDTFFEANAPTFMWPESREKAFSKERWDLWRNSFAWVGDMEGVEVGTREVAIAAADEMVRLEGEEIEGQEVRTPGAGEQGSIMAHGMALRKRYLRPSGDRDVDGRGRVIGERGDGETE